MDNNLCCTKVFKWTQIINLSWKLVCRVKIMIMCKYFAQSEIFHWSCIIILMHALPSYVMIFGNHANSICDSYHRVILNSISTGIS